MSAPKRDASLLAVDRRHVGIAVAPGRCNPVEHGEVFLGQLDVERGHVLFEIPTALGSRDRNDVAALGEQPCEGELTRRTVLAPPNGLETVDEIEVMRKMLASVGNE